MIPPISRTLSSVQTFWVKVVFPVLIHGGFGFTVLGIWLGLLHPLKTLTHAEWLEFFGFWVAMGVLIRSIGFLRIKRVRVDGDAILISNYWSETRVPIALIERVSDEGGIYLPLIEIRFSAPTVFGSRILFTPKRYLFDGSCRMFFGTRSHRVVGELRDLMREAR